MLLLLRGLTKPCIFWSKGECNKAINCDYAHEGLPKDSKTCITCNSKKYVSSDCTAPGGAKDPKKDEVWAACRERRDKAIAEGRLKAPNPKKGKGKGKTNGQQKPNGKGKTGKGQGKENLKAGAFFEEAARAAPVREPQVFPKNGIGIDTWANAHDIHKKWDESDEANHELKLAHGKCNGRRDVGRKGVPRILAPKKENQENNDLFHAGFLHERGCIVELGDDCIITTPKGRVFSLKFWGSLPYIFKVENILHDLPEVDQPGRRGSYPEPPTAARASRTHGQALSHLNSDMSKDQARGIQSNSRRLDDMYYDGENPKTPESFPNVLEECILDHKEVAAWEWCSGSSILSKTLRDAGVRHLPLIDYRFQWNLARGVDQRMLLQALHKLEVKTLYISPDCAYWGTHARRFRRDQVKSKRESESAMLALVAVCCTLQTLLGRRYIIESYGMSDILPLVHSRC